MHDRSQKSGSSSKIWGLVAVTLLALGVGWWLWAGRGSADETATAEAADADADANKLALISGRERERKSLHAKQLATQPKATITGTVSARGGGPLAGARVCVWARSNELRGLGDSRPICARTEHDGHYRVEGLWPVGVDVEASAAGHMPRKWMKPESTSAWLPQLRLHPGEVREGVDLELEPGGTKVTGVVKDISGGEIEGALVTAGTGWFDEGARAVGRSDEDGRFELWTKPGEVEISALAEGYARSRTSAHSPSAIVEIFLTPESVLVGRVVHAETGEPVADVTVSARGSSWGGSSGDSVRSDADGRFRIGGLSPGVYKPAARADTFFGETATQVHLGLGQTSEPVEIRVHPVAYIEGRIVVAGTDRGCAEGSVTLERLGTKERTYAGVEDDGRVIARGVLPGEYEVTVSCVGMVAEAEYPNIEVADENIIDLVWEVREGLAIRGVVVDSDGQPIADINVSGRMQVDASNARAQTTSSWSGRTKDDGSFELAGLLAGTYELGVFGGERPTERKPTIVELESGADRNDVRIELPATGQVRGRVVDDQGVGQANVQVVAGPLGEWKQSDTRTDDQGNFVLEHVQAGEVRVKATSDRWNDTLRRPGTTDDDEQGEVVTVAADAVVEVELVVERRTGEIRGRVLDETGAPVDDAFIHVERMSDSATANEKRSRNAVRWDWNSKPHLSDTDGSFAIDGLSEGTYVVRAHRKGGGEAIAEGVELGTSVELTIAPTGVLAGVVRIAGGEPLERFTINASDREAGLRFSDSYFRTDGRWELRELPAGNYEIIAESPVGIGELTVALEGGAAKTDLEIELQARVTVRGRLVDADSGAPVPGMTVQVSARGGRWSFGWDEKPGKEVSDEQGNFEVENAATGKVMLAIMPRNFNSTNEYGWTMLNRTIAAEPAVQELGDVKLLRDRLKPGDAAGELGFELVQSDPATEPEDERLEVALIRPGGPAEGSGLAVGDVIEAIDGTSVVGADSFLYWKLTRAPAGTVLELSIAGGKTVTITLGAPRE